MLSAEPKAKADNSYLDLVLLYIVLKKIMTNTSSQGNIHCAHNLQISQLSASR